jgi:hypothetical protein
MDKEILRLKKEVNKLIQQNTKIFKYSNLDEPILGFVRNKPNGSMYYIFKVTYIGKDKIWLLRAKNFNI